MDAEASGDDRSADRVVLAYPADLPDRPRDPIEAPYYREALHKTLGWVTADETDAEFTDVGCCGSQRRVPRRVESDARGDVVGAGTGVVHAERAVGGLPGAWSVQNEVAAPGKRKSKGRFDATHR
jgi:hypothetical protein